MARVEARLNLTGKGMAADPEYIQALGEEIARKERVNSPRPRKPFKKVIEEKSKGS